MRNGGGIVRERWPDLWTDTLEHTHTASRHDVVSHTGKHIKHTSGTTRGKTKDQQRYAKFSQTCQTAELFTHLTSKNVVFKEDQINNTKRDVLSVLSGWIQMAISPLIKNIPSSGLTLVMWPTLPSDPLAHHRARSSSTGEEGESARAREREEGCGGGDPEMWWERKEGGGGRGWRERVTHMWQDRAGLLMGKEKHTTSKEW